MSAAARKPTLAVVTPFFPLGTRPTQGRSTYQMMVALRERFELTVICPIPDYPKWLTPRRYDYRRVDVNYRVALVEARYIGFPALPAITRPINAATCARYIEPILQQLDPDIILNFWIYPQGRGALLAGRRLGIRVVVGAIGSDLNAIPDAITRRLAARTLQQADHVITKSDALRRRAIAMGAGAEHVTTIHNGCDHQLFAPGDCSEARRALNIGADDRVIVFIGRLEDTKGVAELLDAGVQVRQSFPRLRLVYVGDGPMEEPLREAAQQQRASWVQFAGAQAPTQVAQWLIAADLLALPSYAEGCPNVVLEALSCGRPVVATNVGGIPEMVDEHCAILVPPRDTAALSAALQSALEREWSEAAIAAQFGRTWEDVADDVEAVLLKVLQQPAACNRAMAGAAQ
jgi:teichuronic acid biosynthesis glycosyltransferase TuaC